MAADSTAGDSTDDPAAELAQVDENLRVARQQVDELRAERADPDVRPDTADDAEAIRELEDRQVIIEALEARRATLAAQVEPG